MLNNASRWQLVRGSPPGGLAHQRSWVAELRHSINRDAEATRP
jgi:hypothetical protein